MVMRKGEHFRADKLVYPEIGDTLSAAAPLIENGWLDPAPALDLPTLFRLFTKAELGGSAAQATGRAGVPNSARKADWLEALSELEDGYQAPPDKPVYRLTLMPLCDRFRLMFFGNLYQDWSEFVLSDLGTFQYEPVSFSQGVRPFQSRRDVDAYLHLNACRDQFQAAPPWRRWKRRCRPRRTAPGPGSAGTGCASSWRGSGSGPANWNGPARCIAIAAIRAPGAGNCGCWSAGNITTPP